MVAPIPQSDASAASDCEIEVRQLFELEDFGESEVLDRFRELGLAARK